MIRPQDHAYEFLLRGAIPLVLAPAVASPVTGSLRAGAPAATGGQRTGASAAVRRLRGVVRVDDDHARVAFTDDPANGHGVAFHLTLPGTLQPHYDHTALTRTRVLAGMQWTSGTRDSHDNLIVDTDTDLHGEPAGDAGDLRLHSLFTDLLGTGDLPWFTEFFLFAGFMLVPAGQVRLYARDARDGVVHGAQFPARSGSSNLAQELVPLIRERQLQQLPLVEDTDEYCTAVYDISTFTGRIAENHRAGAR